MCPFVTHKPFNYAFLFDTDGDKAVIHQLHHDVKKIKLKIKIKIKQAQNNKTDSLRTDNSLLCKKERLKETSTPIKTNHNTIL